MLFFFFFFFAPVGLIFASSRPEVSVTRSGKVATKLVKEDGSVCFYGWQCDGSQHPKLSQFQGFCQESTTNNFMCKCCFLWESHLGSNKLEKCLRLLCSLCPEVCSDLFYGILVVNRIWPMTQQHLLSGSKSFCKSSNGTGTLVSSSILVSACQVAKKKTWGCFFPSFPDDFFSSRQVWILETWKHGTGFPCRCPSANLS